MLAPMLLYIPSLMHLFVSLTQVVVNVYNAAPQLDRPRAVALLMSNYIYLLQVRSVVYTRLQVQLYSALTYTGTCILAGTCMM